MIRKQNKNNCIIKKKEETRRIFRHFRQNHRRRQPKNQEVYRRGVNRLA